jgi:hypothetical protein
MIVCRPSSGSGAPRTIAARLSPREQQELAAAGLLKRLVDD